MWFDLWCYDACCFKAPCFCHTIQKKPCVFWPSGPPDGGFINGRRTWLCLGGPRLNPVSSAGKCFHVFGSSCVGPSCSRGTSSESWQKLITKPAGRLTAFRSVSQPWCPVCPTCFTRLPASENSHNWSLSGFCRGLMGSSSFKSGAGRHLKPAGQGAPVDPDWETLAHSSVRWAGYSHCLVVKARSDWIQRAAQWLGDHYWTEVVRSVSLYWLSSEPSSLAMSPEEGAIVLVVNTALKPFCL